MFTKIAENTTNYTKKGTLVAVEGRLQQEKWETDAGEKRNKVVVIAENVEFLEWGDKKKENSFAGDFNYDDFTAMDEDESIPF